MENEYQTSVQQQEKVLTIGDWMVTILLLCIPLVNIIMLIVWACSSSTPKSKKNFAIAQLIYMAIAIVLSFLFMGALIGFISAAGGM